MSKQKMKPEEVVNTRMSSLLGEVLTLIEAVIPHESEVTFLANSSSSGAGGTSIRNNSQLESTKSLIRSFFSKAQSDIINWIK